MDGRTDGRAYWQTDKRTETQTKTQIDTHWQSGSGQVGRQRERESYVCDMKQGVRPTTYIFNKYINFCEFFHFCLMAIRAVLDPDLSPCMFRHERIFFVFFNLTLRSIFEAKKVRY